MCCKDRVFVAEPGDSQSERFLAVVRISSTWPGFEAIGVEEGEERLKESNETLRREPTVRGACLPDGPGVVDGKKPLNTDAVGQGGGSVSGVP